MSSGATMMHQAYTPSSLVPVSSAPPMTWGRGVTVGPGHGPLPTDAAGQYPNTANPWEPFFGKAPRPIYQQPYERENYDLPDVYVGQNYFMSRVMITRITQAEMRLVSQVLPWTRKEDNDQIKWDVIKFNDHLLNRRPEESVSRLLTSEKQEQSAAYVTYGIAMILESGFFRTQEGRMNYVNNLKQIANATIETACLGAMTELLNAEPYKDTYAELNDLGLNRAEFDRVLGNEVNNFGIVHKEEQGLELVLDKCKQQLTARGVSPNTVILPEGTLKFLKNSRIEYKNFLYSGTTAEKGPNLSQFGSVFESRAFRIGEKRPPYDPAFQERTVGNYFFADAQTTKGVEAEHYRTAMRDIFAWSEQRDNWVRHSINDLLQNSGLFQVDADMTLTELGARFFGDYRSWLDYLDGHNARHTLVDGIAKVRAKCDRFRVFVQRYLGSILAAPTAVVHKTNAAAAFDFKTAATVLFSNTNGPGPAYISAATRFREIYNSTNFFVPNPNYDVLNFYAVVELAASKGSFLIDPADTLATEAKAKYNAMYTITGNNKMEGYILTYDLNLNGLSVVKTDFSSAANMAVGTQGQAEAAAMATIIEKKAIPDGKEANAFWDTRSGGKTCGFYVQEPLAILVEAYLAYVTGGGTDAFLQWALKKTLDPTDKRTKFRQLFHAICTRGEVVAGAFSVGDDVHGHYGAYERHRRQRSVSGHSGSSRAQRDDYLYGRFTGADGEVKLDSSKVKARFHLSPSLVDSLKANSTSMTAMHRELVMLAPWVTMDSDFFDEYGELLLRAIVAQVVLHNAKGANIFSHNEAVYAFRYFACAMTMIYRDLCRRVREASVAAASVASEAKVATDPDAKILESAASSADSSESKKRLREFFGDMSSTQDADGLGQKGAIGHDFKAFDTIMRTASTVIRNGGQVAAGDAPGNIVASIVQRYDNNIASTPEIAAFYGPVYLAWRSAIQANGTVAGFDTNVDENRVRATRVMEILDSKAELGTMMLQNGRTLQIAERLQEAHDLSHPINAPTDDLNIVHGRMHVASSSVGGVSMSSGSGTGVGAEYDIDMQEVPRTGTHFRSDGFPGRVPSDLGGDDFSVGARVDVSDQFDNAAAVVNLVNGVYAERYNAVETLLRVMPITDGQFLQWCCDADVPLPVSFLMFAPHMRYQCGTAVMCVSGRELGATFYGWPDFQLARNVNQKMIFGHFTLKLKALVVNNMLINWARDIYIRMYLGGGGHCYWKYDTDDVHKYRSGNLDDRDLFIVAVPPDWRPKDFKMDITGFWDGNVYGAEQSLQYPTAHAYSAHWGWCHGEDPLKVNYEPTEQPRFNTVVYEGSQVNFRYTGNGTGDWKDFVINTGHLGDRIYPGCAKTRKGQSMSLLPVDYTKTAALAVIT